MTWRGPHDWATRGVVWLSPYDGSGEVVVCEGIEDGLSIIEAGGANVAAILGVARLGKVQWPWGVRKLVVARDDDPPGTPGDNALYRGVVRQLGGGMSAYVLPRPRMMAPGADVLLKDANDLFLHDLAKVWEWLCAPPSGPEDLGHEARNSVLDTVSRMSGENYERARKAVASMLGFGRVKALDDARAARIDERKAAQQGAEEVADEPWPDPILNIGEVLDEAVTEVSRYIKASPHAIHAVVLWGASAHVLQRGDLHVNIAPRLYINSPVPGCGKTLLLEIIAAFTPRSMMLSSVSVSGLFREIDARKPTLCLDEFDKQLAGASQEYQAILDSGHRKTSAFVLRSAKTEDGQFIREKFSTFTAMAFSGIKKLPDSMTARCIIVALQRAGADDSLEHLVDGSSEKLTEIRRKLARWAQDLTDLPMVDRPKALANRLGDNWYTIRRIGKLAGEAWNKRAMDAAVKPAMTADTNVTLALLAAIWRAFDETKLLRMHTEALLSELLGMDEGRWKEEQHGRPITAYYLRDNLGDMLPANAEEIAPRRWREGTANPQWGYDVLHFKDAFLRYLGKGMPGADAGKGGAQSSAQNDPKTSDTSAHPAQDTGNAGIPGDSAVSDESVGSGESPSPDPALSDGGAGLGAEIPPDPTLSSDTEKTEENEAPPGDRVGHTDVSDDSDPLRALFEGRPFKGRKGAAPKSAAGRKARKG